MKILNIKFLAVLLLVMLTSIKSFSQIAKAEIIATGLTCSMCSNAINKQLKSMTEVDSISTDLNTNTFTVHFKENSMVQPKVLKNAVEKAGFFVGSMVLNMKIDTEKVKDNLISIDGATFVFVDTKNPISDDLASYQVMDKGFITQKEYKKISKSYSKYTTYSAENENNYHLKPIQ